MHSFVADNKCMCVYVCVCVGGGGVVILNACPQRVRRCNRSCLERGGGAFTSLSPGEGVES